MPLEFTNSTLYTVQSGDTCSTIADAHGITLESLIAANVGIISDPSLIQVGWELIIPGELTGTRRSPAPSGDGVTSYTIQSGDTLGALAERWGTTVAAIAELNGIANAALIFVGQRIRKPGASSEAAVEPAPADPAAIVPVVVATTEAATAIPVVPGKLEFVRWPLDMPPAIVTGGYRQDYGNYLHRGIDLGGVPVGTPIFAPAGGIVTVHRPGDGWGNGSFGINVVIDHVGTPWWTIYAHMSDTPRITGEQVGLGDHIGDIGFTGFVIPEGPAGAHLHWQLSAHSGFPQGFEYIANPLDFLVA